MKNFLLGALSLTLLLMSCSSVRVLGTKIKQSDLCIELGSSKTCNPLPFGSPKILNYQRLKFKPVSFTEEGFKELGSRLIGGLYINTKAVAEANTKIDTSWIEYDYGSVSRDAVEKIKKTIKVEISLSDILDGMIAKGIFPTSYKDEAQDVLEPYYNQSIEKEVTLNLVYHSIKLNEKFFNKYSANDPIAISLMNRPNTISNPSKIKTFETIGGLGFIEYRGSVNDTIVTGLGGSLDAVASLNTYSKAISTEFKKEVNKSIKRQIPNKLDLIFVSTLSDLNNFNKK
ncbi:hypothetical protein DCS32_13995 [Dokdonia sp. Dokd-P16]|uniref:hypothetical protein n=1 Tax=Dokdonia sp. Dokd-P16 TaxID=2173169 RepID=UPI000D546F22|nr:hypothetical protein [Dokdonia sp. Dokd-P16]AWH75234.1 hypothetical protein DCS32_13995 [Dokdonia sp. Dokd-P16]